MTNIVDRFLGYFIVEFVAVSRAPGLGVGGVEWVDGSGGAQGSMGIYNPGAYMVSRSIDLAEKLFFESTYPK